MGDGEGTPNISSTIIIAITITISLLLRLLLHSLLLLQFAITVTNNDELRGD